MTLGTPPAPPERARRERSALARDGIMRVVGLPQVARRVRKLAARAAYVLWAQGLYWLAVLWRRALRRTTFVAVTGTHAKTTTKEMLATMLASRQSTFRTTGNQNTGLALTLNVLRVRPWHRFAVIEIGVGAPGEMRRLGRLVRPDVAVILTVLHNHLKAFGDQRTHAREKAALLEALRPGGVAVLNADDPLVAAMAEGVRGTVVRTGTSPAFDVWAEGATSCWPARLEFDVRTREGESCHVRTRLVGTHWCVSATAALAAARSAGVPLHAAAAALGAMEPFVARMQPILLPSGAVMLRDDYDGSFDAFQAAVRALSDARAARRIAVVSDASDYGTTSRGKRVARLGRAVAGAAELVVFVGGAAAHGRRGALAAGVAPGNAHGFEHLPEAAGFLRRTLRPGDLVLLKGRDSDHLARLFLAQLGEVSCWKRECGKRTICDDCPEAGVAPGDRASAQPAPITWTAGGDP